MTVTTIAHSSFEFYPLRFYFRARDTIHFPVGKPGNILRGAFGTIFRKIACVPTCMDSRTCELRASCAYARTFDPAAAGAGPSGFSDWPRPFVFRARHLDGQTVTAGEPFHFDLHSFDVADGRSLAYFVLTFAQLAREGLGPRRGRAELEGVCQLTAQGAEGLKIFDGATFLLSESPEPVRLTLETTAAPVGRVRVEFLSPTELKDGQQLARVPEFSILFGRIRDRLSTLRALYGAGPLAIDFKSMGERAAAVRLARCDIRRVAVERLSSRTGQRHPLGGFVGSAEYEGEIAEFVPYLEAGRWIGVGRQTVWGKGEIAWSAFK